MNLYTDIYLIEFVELHKMFLHANLTYPSWQYPYPILSYLGKSLKPESYGLLFTIKPNRQQNQRTSRRI